ncbi:FtsB family cell division protein [Polluticoccus soli]|uniref:FtsB family cell division protein n=1 Tax=Polluticoccus soli TaxID=3034150 RepID=UPI0023E0F368|nr:septum formation initiator family protein [Flavipsychrobacter sp. JY13-12]
MKKVLQILTNKFLLTLLAFGAWMAYFDQHDWVSMQEKKKNLQDMKDNIAYLDKEIAKMEKEKTGMVSDPQVLEQYAREQYRMKRDNEDLYIIEK